jgi:hypothetical protein
MKKAILLLALSAAAIAAPYPKIRLYDFHGPFTILAGYRSVFAFKPDFAFDFTCNTNDICSAGNGYLPSAGTIGTIDSTGTVPGGLFTTVQNAWPSYAICNPSGNTFQLEQSGCGGSVVDITSTGTGIHTFSIYNYLNKKIYLDAPPTGFPAGTTFEWRTVGAGYACNIAGPTEAGKIYRPFGGDSAEGGMCLFATVPPNAAPGTGTVSMTWCETTTSTNCATFNWPIEVVNLTPTVPSPPISFTPVPGRSTWISTMTAAGLEAGGGAFCSNPDNPSEVFIDCPESAVSYYDGGLSYLNIARYLRSPSWGNCGRNILKFCREYVNINLGGIPAYKVFCEGYMRGASEPQLGDGKFDGTYTQTAKLLGMSTYVLYGARPRYGYDREMAYALTTAACIHRHLGIENQRWNDLRDAVYGLLLRYTETSSSHRGETQGFYMGLLAKAIIYDWQLSHDGRAPYVVKRLLDRVQATYNTSTHVMMYATGADGSPWCSSSVLWFQGDPYFNCQVNAGQKLQGLVAPAFGWYYALTGNTTYRDEGDDWFQHTFDAGAYTGKEFAQIYYWTFNYVGWREGWQSAFRWYGE